MAKRIKSLPYIPQEKLAELSDSEREQYIAAREEIIDELYRRYKRDYRVAARRMDRAGDKMHTPMESKEDFFTDYMERKNDLENYAENMRKSGRVSPQEVIDSIISDQRYKMSIRQARAFALYLSSENPDGWDDRLPKAPATLTNIRRGRFKDLLDETLFDEITKYRERRRKELQDLGYSRKDINEILVKEVRETIIGSP